MTYLSIKGSNLSDAEAIIRKGDCEDAREKDANRNERQGLDMVGTRG